MTIYPLVHSPLFAAFSRAEISQLLQHATERNMFAGEILFQRGDAGSSMVAILAGEVRIELPDPLGTTHVLRVLKAGELFGELALLMVNRGAQMWLRRRTDGFLSSDGPPCWH